MEYIIVQAGGKGSRLKYLTENKPKALVPVDNLPMLFHLFRKYPDKRFVIIADYKKEVMREYLEIFADVKYNIVEAMGDGTCAGVKQAIDLIPEDQAFMLVWSDLILPSEFQLPEGYSDSSSYRPKADYIGLSQSFPCRWKYQNGKLFEEKSIEYGVAGLFLFTEKAKLKDIPENGEFVRWLQQKNDKYETIGLFGTKEFGLIEEYEKLEQVKCRPFNRTSKQDGIFTKEPIGEQGCILAKRECAWYEKAKELEIQALPKIFETNPLKMELIQGKNIYECNLSKEQKENILTNLVNSIKMLHDSQKVPTDSFSIKEAYFNKTFDRLAKIQDLIPFGRNEYITINDRRCRNVYFYKRELEKALDHLVANCEEFAFIHGDCTFSNIMLRDNGDTVLIDPRGYFGYTELYGDIRYDWAKLFYSVVGNYDQFNLKRFRLQIGKDSQEGIRLEISSNQWEDMADEFFRLTGQNEYEIKLLHAIIWLSLTTYAWQDYDSICGAFYNGLYYLEEVL